MIHRSYSFAILFISAITFGCAPLQQAPLVYSSKVVVGVDVSMSIAENQGGSINIGVKSVDSAYVPVAVSKTLDEHAKDDGKSLDIQIIAAKYGEGSSPDKQDDASALERNRKIDEYFYTKQAVSSATDELNAAEKQVKDINNLISQVENIRAGIIAAQNMTDNPPSTQRSDAFQKISTELTQLNQARGLSFSMIQAEQPGGAIGANVIGEMDQWLVKEKADKATAEGALPAIKSKLQAKSELAGSAKAEAIRVVGLSQTDKTDAMSVYGRFDSTGVGDAKGGAGSLLVGKVFSTGLASQNLTEAVKISAKNACVTNAFSLAQTMTSGKEKDGFIMTIERMCGYAKK